MTANLQERNRFATGKFWRGSQPFFGAKPFAPARFAVPGVSSLTAVSRHDSHNSLPSCLPFGGGLTHQHIASELICLFSDSGHLPNTVFTIFYLSAVTALCGAVGLQVSPLGLGISRKKGQVLILYACVRIQLKCPVSHTYGSNEGRNTED